MNGLRMKYLVIMSLEPFDMVIDTSALIAILLGEQEAEKFAKLITLDEKRLLSSFSALETGIVIKARKGEIGSQNFELLLYKCKIRIIDFSLEQFKIALTAWKNFGKGNHPAGLNIGDCCSYALAKYSNEPLLFKGNDFARTDIKIII